MYIVHLCREYFFIILFRIKKDYSTVNEELRGFKKREITMEGELDSLRHEVDRARPKLLQLSQYKEELQSLTEANNSLQMELSSLQDHYDSIVHEKDDLEQQTKEVYEALNEEREAKSLLETKLRKDTFITPNREGVARGVALLKKAAVSDDMVTTSVPTSPTGIQNSTPFTAHTSKEMPSLLSELQNSLMSSEEDSSHTHQDEVIAELESKNSLLAREKEDLEGQVSAILSDLDKWKNKHQELADTHETDLNSLRDELEAKKEIVNQLNNKINSLNGEKVSLEIEADGIKDEMTRFRESSQTQLEQLMKELGEEQARKGELKSRLSEIEDKLMNTTATRERLETILLSSRDELDLMKDGMNNLHKAINSLQQQQQPNARTGSIENSRTSEEGYTIIIRDGGVKEKSKSIAINRESQCLTEVIQLKDLLQSMWSPLESFTKNMLQHSLKQSTEQPLLANGKGFHGNGNGEGMGSMANSPFQSPRRVPSSNSEGDKPDDSKEMEAIINKLRAKLANRTEEVTQLRTIMKARQTTGEVTVSSLKSKLEGQARSHEAEINQFKNKLKTLRKERDDQTSLCALTSKRCQEYLGEISKLKRKIDEAKSESNRLRSEAKLLDVYLQRAIKQKLDISQKLERYQEEEERSKVIPLTLSASRV